MYATDSSEYYLNAIHIECIPLCAINKVQEGYSLGWDKSTLSEEVPGLNFPWNTCVDLSFCCISFNPIDFSLEQNMLIVLRQAFILY